MCPCLLQPAACWRALVSAVLLLWPLTIDTKPIYFACCCSPSFWLTAFYTFPPALLAAACCCLLLHAAAHLSGLAGKEFPKSCSPWLGCLLLLAVAQTAWGIMLPRRSTRQLC